MHKLTGIPHKFYQKVFLQLFIYEKLVSLLYAIPFIHDEKHAEIE